MSDYPHSPDEMGDPAEKAISARLGRLRTRPVDLARVQARLREEISPARRNGLQAFWSIRPLRAAAAILTLAAMTLLVVMATTSRPAIASTDSLLRLHEAVVSQVPHDAGNIASMEAANAAIRGEWKGAPSLPDVPDEQVMNCSVHQMGRAKAACVLLSVDGTPVTLAAAESRDVIVDAHRPVQRGGRTFEVRSSEGVSMVMTEYEGSWYCLIGRLPAEQLMAFWDTLDLKR